MHWFCFMDSVGVSPFMIKMFICHGFVDGS